MEFLYIIVVFLVFAALIATAKWFVESEPQTHFVSLSYYKMCGYSLKIGDMIGDRLEFNPRTLQYKCRMISTDKELEYFESIPGMLDEYVILLSEEQYQTFLKSTK